MAWMASLARGLQRWCAPLAAVSVDGVQIQIMRPSFPILFLSGCTPGPFYHSHPHIPSEFDYLSFDMASQVRYNVKTIRKIAEAVVDHSNELPFDLAGSNEFMRSPLLLNWVSNNGPGIAANAKVLEETMPLACEEEGLSGAELIGLFETGGNVSDRRFLLETFGMFGLEHAPLGELATTVRIELRSLFDSVDYSTEIYTVGNKRCYMPYVPGYVVCGPADLAVFTVSAASGEHSVPSDGAAQVNIVITKLCQVLGELGATFDDVVLIWDRVAHLDENEHAVLMTRSERGLTRPLAEAVLEIAPSDPNGNAPNGTPIVLEYIVVAQIPQQAV